MTTGNKVENDNISVALYCEKASLRKQIQLDLLENECINLTCCRDSCINLVKEVEALKPSLVCFDFAIYCSSRDEIHRLIEDS